MHNIIKLFIVSELRVRFLQVLINLHFLLTSIETLKNLHFGLLQSPFIVLILKYFIQGA